MGKKITLKEARDIALENMRKHEQAWKDYWDEESKENKNMNEIESVDIDSRKSKEFLHCKKCLETFQGSELHAIMSPRDYGMYEVSTYDFSYPDGSVAEIVVMWCKRCGGRVWDSRRLGPLLTNREEAVD